MKRWILILISAILILTLFHVLAIRRKKAGLEKLRKCSDVTAFTPSGPIASNDQPVSGHVYVVPKPGECKEE